MTSYAPSRLAVTGSDFDEANKAKAHIDSHQKTLTRAALEDSYRRAGFSYGPGGKWLPPIIAPFNLGEFDVDKLVIDNEGLHEELRAGLTGAKADFTIEGASTIILSVEDPNDQLFNVSPKVAEKFKTASLLNLDGFKFRLVKVSKQKKNYTLTFEDELINKLRQRGTKKGEKKRWERGQYTRAQAVFAMVAEVLGRWNHNDIFIPELLRSQPYKEPKQKPKASAFGQKEYGFSGGQHFDIEGKRASPVQISCFGEVLEQGLAQHVDRKGLIMAIMTVLQESKANTVFNSNPETEGVGAFSQIKSDGWPATGNVKKDAKAFFDRLLTVERSGHIFKSYGYEINAVQGSAYPTAYDQWKAVSTEVVNAFSKGNTFPTLGGTSSEKSELAKPYYFERREYEDSWTCIQRLAKEVQWRAFVVRNVFYFVEEASLLKAGPIFEVSEHKDADGVDWIDWEKDEGQAFETAKVQCDAKVWSIFPGSMIEVVDPGPAAGVWLVYNVEVDLFRAVVQVTINAAVKQLPEPAPTYETISKRLTGSGAPSAAPGGGKYGALIGNSAKYVGPDQGIDFTGKAPVFALDDCIVTRVDLNTGWPGEGNIIVYELTGGPHKGRFVYHAEDIRPVPGCKRGTRFSKGNQIAEATGVWKAPGIECGFAQDSGGSAYGNIHEGKGSNPPDKEALAFLAYVEQESKS